MIQAMDILKDLKSKKINLPQKDLVKESELEYKHLLCEGYHISIHIQKQSPSNVIHF